MTFNEQLTTRCQRLVITMISKKMVTGMVWSVVATLLLVYKFIGENTWSFFVLAMIGLIFGYDIWQNKMGVQNGSK